MNIRTKLTNCIHLITSQNADAKTSIAKITGNDKIHTFTVNLSSQEDVKRFANEIKTKFTKIHYLINNSGIVTSTDDFHRLVTKEGYEHLMSTNYFGGYTY